MARAIVLKVKDEELIRAANDISKQIQSVERAFQSVEQAIKNSGTYWEGDASDLHRKKFTAMKNDINSTLKLIKNRPDDLLKMAGLYKETEDVNTETAGSLSDNPLK